MTSEGFWKLRLARQVILCPSGRKRAETVFVSSTDYRAVSTKPSCQVGECVEFRKRLASSCGTGTCCSWQHFCALALSFAFDAIRHIGCRGRPHVPICLPRLPARTGRSSLLITSGLHDNSKLLSMRFKPVFWPFLPFCSLVGCEQARAV